MKILLCHNFYQLPGGEDQVYRDEGWLLEQAGHQVIRFERDNRVIAGISQMKMAAMTVWNRESHQAISQLLRDDRPDLVHFHNTFPIVSPSGYYAARSAGVPVVQTMHNFRTICPASTLLRDGAVCERCINKAFAWPAVVHKCYRDSRRASTVTAISASIHRMRGTRHKCIDRYIVLTEHSRQRFVASGLDPVKVSVKPNFVRPDPGQIDAIGNDAVFVGRLSNEKGINTLLAAWRLVERSIPLKIIGDGPLRAQVLEASERNPAIQWLGQMPLEHVLQQVGRAQVLICPSIWYETFGRTMIEAFATGTPVIASDIGSMRELVSNGENGLHFRAGDAADLAAKVDQLYGDEGFRTRAGNAAREEFERKYTPERNYQMLMAIYRQTIDDSAPTTG